MNLGKVFMYCYNANSDGGKLLAQTLGVLRIKHEGSTFYGNADHTVLNWGCSPGIWHVNGHPGEILNHPSKVYNACNKIRCFTRLDGYARVPDWTVEGDTAIAWLKQGHCVIGRQTVEGMGGEGIVIMERPVDFTACKLYTKYVEKEREFRLYMVRDKMVDFCVKRRKLDETPKNWKIRSRGNGFVFCWTNLDNLPQDVIVQSQKAMKRLGLDYGGVDVIFNEEEQKAYILEVNTAPWLSEYTAELMATEIKESLLAA